MRSVKYYIDHLPRDLNLIQLKVPRNRYGVTIVWRNDLFSGGEKKNVIEKAPKAVDQADAVKNTLEQNSRKSAN